MLARYELTVALKNIGNFPCFLATCLCCVVLCNTSIVRIHQKLEFLSDTSEFTNSSDIKDTLWHLKVCLIWIFVKMQFEKKKMLIHKNGLGLMQSRPTSSNKSKYEEIYNYYYDNLAVKNKIHHILPELKLDIYSILLTVGVFCT